MNFTFEIKKELIFKKMNKQQTKAFIQGILLSNNKLESLIKIQFNNKDFVQKIEEFLSQIGLNYSMDKNQILIESKKSIVVIDETYASFYFAGIFVSSGSISNLDSSSYHLEIGFKSENICDYVLEFASKHIIFNKIKNKNHFVLYLKKNELISDFLQIIGANKSYFNFIDSIIERDFKNQITRIFNLDVHNQNRLVDSNIIFKENYQYILEHRLTSRFKPLELEFYEFKRKNEFLSLAQLSEEFCKNKNVKITKSGLNHWLIKLRNVCEENENQKIFQAKKSLK